MQWAVVRGLENNDGRSESVLTGPYPFTVGIARPIKRTFYKQFSHLVKCTFMS